MDLLIIADDFTHLIEFNSPAISSISKSSIQVLARHKTPCFLFIKITRQDKLKTDVFRPKTGEI